MLTLGVDKSSAEGAPPVSVVATATSWDSLDDSDSAGTESAAHDEREWTPSQRVGVYARAYESSVADLVGSR